MFLPTSYKANNFSFQKCLHFSSENPPEMLISPCPRAQAVLPKHPRFPCTAAEEEGTGRHPEEFAAQLGLKTVELWKWDLFYLKSRGTGAGPSDAVAVSPVLAAADLLTRLPVEARRTRLVAVQPRPAWLAGAFPRHGVTAATARGWKVKSVMQD